MLKESGLLAGGQTWCSNKHLGIRHDQVSLSGIAGQWVVPIKGGDLCFVKDRGILLKMCENGKLGDAICGFEDDCNLFTGGERYP